MGREAARGEPAIDAALGPVAPSPYSKALHGRRRFQGIPGIETSGGGGLVATWYGGGEGEGPQNFVMLAGSADRGDTWGDVLLVVDPADGVRAFDPGLWRSPDRQLHWFWNQSHGTFDGRAGVWLSRAVNPSDPGAWRPPVRIANGVMMNKPTPLSKGGPWLFPTAVWNTKTASPSGPPGYLEESSGQRFPNILITEDRGRTFTLRIGPDVCERSYDEHMLVERSDGTLLLFVRTHYGIGARRSHDQGRTWRSYVESHWTHDVYRVGPSTRFFVRKLPSGRWLMVYHEHPRARCNLTAYLSEDEGTTWSRGLLLDERPNVSYPDGTVEEDGTIHIIYDRERHGAQEILCARLTERDVLGRAAKDPGSRLRILVNRGADS